MEFWVGVKTFSEKMAKYTKIPYFSLFSPKFGGGSNFFWKKMGVSKFFWKKWGGGDGLTKKWGGGDGLPGRRPREPSHPPPPPPLRVFLAHSLTYLELDNRIPCQAKDPSMAWGSRLKKSLLHSMSTQFYINWFVWKLHSARSRYTQALPHPGTPGLCIHT